MSTSNSNIVARRWAIGKAVLLALVLMGFSAGGAAVATRVESVNADKIAKLEAELAAMRSDKETFLAGMKKIKTSWSKYEKIQQQSLVNDSLSGNLDLKIKDQDKQLTDQLNELEASLKTSESNDVYKPAIDNYRLLVANYARQVADRKALADYRRANEMEGEGDLLAQDWRTKYEELYPKYLQVLNERGGSGATREIDQLNSKLNTCNQKLLSKQAYSMALENLLGDYDDSLEGIGNRVSNLNLSCLNIGCSKSFKPQQKLIIDEVKKKRETLKEKKIKIKLNSIK